MLTLVGAASTEANTITIPSGHAPGDLLVIYAFRSATTAPTLATGWTNVTNGSSGASSFRFGRKTATTAAETSGTWTNATGLICYVFRGAATDITPVGSTSVPTGTGTSVNFNQVALGRPYTSWMIAFIATKTTDSSLETPPTGMVNRTNTVGSAVEYSGHDSNGPFNKETWPTTGVSIGGTSAEWRSLTTEIKPDQINIENYKHVGASASNAGVISVTEKIF